ncbi:uncharacterized protein [Bemisia tabaci]|uniref:uncharacterized protein n=1 Tax=Bemisia tabaci TaxID=7038 RepID=UPI003B2824E3
MRASITPHINGALLLAFSFWLGRLGDCRSANNDFFDNIPVDNSPWQPITANRDAPRPPSPKFPPVRYPNVPNHPPPQPQWLAPFNRPPAPTTEKFPKPKFPSSVDGYKSYSPGPLYNPNKEFFDSQPPFSPFDDLRPKPTKEAPRPRPPTTPPAFDAFADSRRSSSSPRRPGAARSSTPSRPPGATRRWRRSRTRWPTRPKRTATSGGSPSSTRTAWPCGRRRQDSAPPRIGRRRRARGERAEAADARRL